MPELCRYCTADWVITRLEEYLPNGDDSSKKAIILCYCRFDPVISPLEPLSRVSQEVESVGGVGK
ncbi:MAG: hypothetical protein F6K40_13115 [Okeania sp. SIO3I5]|uniref:hypothetical protein n=1 Tax=Okeania sp. SIO3I5 TaxID=2607805 RepID=UPI0013BE4551|nr:hypothetical protein [Okeania sp. SIO3I5]NEQ37154.1 hypothetical protein [Okeania sp. SIO3I5]